MRDIKNERRVYPPLSYFLLIIQKYTAAIMTTRIQFCIVGAFTGGVAVPVIPGMGVCVTPGVGVAVISVIPDIANDEKPFVPDSK